MSDTAPSRNSKTDIGLTETEFVAILACLFAILAFSIDAMLPGIPAIAAELSPGNENRALLVVTSFALGMGVATLVAGPLSDAFGRKPVILAGGALYCMGAMWAALAPTLEMLLLARLVQGVGAAGPRVVALATVRDVYSGAKMARIMSLIFIIFSLFPAAAPAVGQLIIWGFGWRGIFGAFVIFAILTLIWMSIRLPETLPVASRRPFQLPVLWEGTRQLMADNTFCLIIVIQGFCFAMLFAVISAAQPMFDQTYGVVTMFPAWFAGMAILAGSASFVNATFVERMGMRFMVSSAIAMQSTLAVLALIIWFLSGYDTHLSFGIFVIWCL
ncbi:MAG: MFS transporter, partial [Pseudomonadota bacterium]